MDKSPSSGRKVYKISPIGRVRAGGDGYRLEIDAEYRAGLNGLDGFSHVDVLWWCHRAGGDASRKTLECGKPYRNAPATLGVFATRSPLRPNPIAVSVAAIIGIDRAAGVIRVPYIDAEDGTPIVDLKPYHPSIERVRNASVPEWCAHWPKCYEDSACFDWDSEILHG